jgi:hypothetical protein
MRAIPAVMPALLLAALFLAGGVSARGDEISRAFLWDQANAGMAVARTRQDFLDATRVYDRLVRDGVRNGSLFFNLGTALLLAGDGNNAVAAFERAERYLGSTADVRVNLRLALAARAGQPDAELPWIRVACFWHFDHSMHARLMIALLGWSLFWLGLLVRLLRPERAVAASTPDPFRAAAGPLLAIGAVAALAFGTSAVVSLVQETAADRTWPERVFTCHAAAEAAR